MKKVLKFLKHNVLGLIIGVIIGGCAIGIADTLLSSSQVGFDKDQLKAETGIDTNATTVEEAINELYEKASHVGECPSGQLCLAANYFNRKLGYLPANDNNSYIKSTFIENLKVGDYIQMVPSITSVRLDGTKSGYTEYNTTATYLNPSELTLWRVIDKNSNGTVDMVSEYVSGTYVNFSGIIGYQYYIKYLNELSGYYENPKYTIGSRHMGYNGQTEILLQTNKFDGSNSTSPWTTSTSTSTAISQERLGAGDMGYETDYNLVKVAYGNLSGSEKAYKVGTTEYGNYWLASRFYAYTSSNDFDFYGMSVCSQAWYGCSYYLRSYNFKYYNNGWHDHNTSNALRPILTLKADITTNDGSGTKDDPYVLG